jgi:hypothetical protein
MAACSLRCFGIISRERSGERQAAFYDLALWYGDDACSHCDSWLAKRIKCSGRVDMRILFWDWIRIGGRASFFSTVVMMSPYAIKRLMRKLRNMERYDRMMRRRDGDYHTNQIAHRHVPNWLSAAFKLRYP